MKLIELNKEKLNSFFADQEYSQFLQSYEWGEFQERTGQKVFRLGIDDVVVLTLIKKPISAGLSYFYCPRGPIFSSGEFNEDKVYDFIFAEIKKLALKEKCLFLRFDPIDKFQTSNSKFQINQTIDVQPSKSLILDLTKSENDLLKEMHQKTRYNIRLAEKKGVLIREAKLNEFDKFWSLMSETVERDGFRLHNKNYYQSILESSLAPAGEGRGEGQAQSELKIKLIFAEYENRIIAANIITFFGDTVTYVHGSSSDNDRNVMAPYLLQWEVIKQAKNLSYKYYDFYGIDEKKWPGVTRFKRGFGGEEINYPGTFDVVFDGLFYNVYRFLRWLRRKI
jgi:lipid II:glycine glycyltransferase (peptidoglycan interpeptide bridge formation enzyme)